MKKNKRMSLFHKVIWILIPLLITVLCKSEFFFPVVIPQTNLPPGVNPQLVQYAMRVFGSTDLTDDQWRQCEDQQKVGLPLNESLLSQTYNGLKKLYISDDNQKKYFLTDECCVQ